LDGLKSVTIGASNGRFRLENDHLIGIENRVLVWNFNWVRDVTIPDEVTKLGESSFEDCSTLETVRFTDESDLNEICGRAFAGSKVSRVYPF
jgi:hypothetical protein